MEAIDAAYEAFRVIASKISSYRHTLITEADVRIKVIDPIFTEVLGWPLAEVLTEDPAGGGFIDYNFTAAGRSHLIVEAKRDGRPLGVDARPAERGFKLNGPVFSAAAAKEGMRQAIWYCATKNAELACVTNGQEWIVFRGNRLGDGRDTFEGVAFVFSSLEKVEQHFAFFYGLLSYTSVRDYEYRAYFQEAEGQPIRNSAYRKALRAAGSGRLLPVGQLAADIERVMTSFFHRLTGADDPEIITACFVETNESHYADSQLARISEDLVNRIKSLDSGGAEELLRLIERATQSRKHEFVIIVGTKGAGKSTFISRFFTHVLQPQLAQACVVARVNLGDSPGDSTSVVEWLDRNLLGAIEEAIFQGEFPDFQELEGIFYDEYTRLKKGAWAITYRDNYSEFQERFGAWVEQCRNDLPHAYIRALVRHVVRNRKKLPVIVFDNADHFDITFQERVYQYARSIYENSLCLVILPITDRTSWQLSRHGALQSFEHESLFLPTPSTDKIIKKRIEFLQARVEHEKERPEDRYFVKRGISLSINDIASFVDSLQRVFLQTADVSDWIGSLANHDVRRALSLARDFVTSPHLNVEDLVAAYVAGTAVAVPRSRAIRALVKGRYDIYPSEQNQFVRNIFGGPERLDCSPLLGLTILQVLSDMPSEDGDSLHAVDNVLEYCRSMNVQPRVAQLGLDALLKGGLCLNYDPTVTDIENATLLEISPSGILHLNWGRTNTEYLGAMADVTPLLSESAYEDLRQAIRPGGGGFTSKTGRFIRYLLDEDKHYIVIPKHVSFASQERLRRDLQNLADRLLQPSNPR